MSWFSDLKIAKKLGFGFGVVEVLMIVLGVFAIAQISKVNASTVDIATNWLPSVRALAELNYDAASVRRDTLNFIVATDKRPHYEEKLTAEVVQLQEIEKRYEPMIAS